MNNTKAGDSPEREQEEKKKDARVGGTTYQERDAEENKRCQGLKRKQSRSLLSKVGGAAQTVRSKERLKQGLEQRHPRRTRPKIHPSRD